MFDDYFSEIIKGDLWEKRTIKSYKGRKGRKGRKGIEGRRNSLKGKRELVIRENLLYT